jgi:hypothetical protein
VVCQNCWLPAEKDQLSSGVSRSEKSFMWLLPFLFYFLCPIFIPQELGNKSHPHRAPYRWKALLQWGAAQCPEGIISDTAITTPVPCSPCYDTSHLGFGGLEPCSLSKDVTPSMTRAPRVGFWRGNFSL